MNDGTKKKIKGAIDKLGESVSYRQIAAESGTTKSTVARYMIELSQKVQQESTPREEQGKRQESTPGGWDGKRRPLLAMIGYLDSLVSPLSSGRPLSRVPDYSMPARG